MKHYKDKNGVVFAYELDGSQDRIIPDHLIAITEAEADALRVPKLTSGEIKIQENAAIQAQIDVLEKGQARAVREAALGIDGAVDRLKALDLKIRAMAGGFVK
ncbi:hypothetical protein [Undibacterium sp.]|uniref:hypothetical protein n=1 Tax=Undibacterium sp. TaxID=1914977 RepID=UPI0025D73DCE|nr:hypothetical protein [Undibacterium sp.]